MPDDGNYTVPSFGGLSTPHATAILTIGSLVVLMLIRRGWRGVSVGGASVSIN